MTNLPVVVGETKLPAEVVKAATAQANSLIEIVEKRNLFMEIDNKRYLYAEAWETIGAFNQTHAVTEWVRPIKEDGETVAWEARVALYKDGEMVGAAEMTCGLDEFPCRGKEGWAKHKAARSACQTWATSKAYRMNFSWVAVLAGFQPTPAEEMADAGIGTKKEHWCPIHNVPFIKKGRMKWWAHKIEGTDQWCNEDKVKKQIDEEEIAATTTSKDVPVTPEEQSQGEMVEGDLMNLPIRNLGDLANAAHNHYGWGWKEILEAIGKKDKSEIIDVKEVWQAIVLAKAK